MAVRRLESRNTSGVSVSIAPLGRLRVPSTLDGRAGKFRRESDVNDLGVDTDLEAVRIWLDSYDDRPQTRQAYEHAVERLYNWSLVERRKALSSLDDDDILAFEEFLGNPQPQWRWICSKGTSRLSPKWTPFICPLSPGSRLATLTTLRLLLQWLANKGYCTVGQSLIRHSTGRHHRPSALILSIAQHALPKCIELDDWYLLRRSLLVGTDNSIQQTETRAVVELMYYGGLSAVEVGEARAHSIGGDGAITWLRVPSRGTELETIYLVPPVAQVIDDLLGDRRNFPPAQDKRSRNIPGKPLDPFLISRRTISPIVSGVFQRAAALASSENNLAAASRFLAYTPHSLLHAFEMHATGGNAGNSLWLLIGAARLAPQVTRRYLTRRALTEEEFERACNSLSRFWELKP
jgi:integrase